MKALNNFIVILLCLMIVGFFANFAQNDYGMKLVITCCGFLAASLLLKASNAIVSYKKITNLFCIIILIWISSVWINIGASEIFFTAYIFLTLFMAFIWPIFIYFTERKKQVKTDFISYFQFFFLGGVFLGEYLKRYNMPGAAVISSLSVLILFPIIIDFYKKGKLFFNSAEGVFYILANLFIYTALIGFRFKLQHWPYADNLISLSEIMFVFLLALIVYFSFKATLIKSFKKLNFVLRIYLLVYFAVVSFYMLRKADLIPQVYSSEMPIAYYGLKEKSIGINSQARLYEKKYFQYRNDYSNFLYINSSDKSK
jgi:hypothetical protein